MISKMSCVEIAGPMERFEASVDAIQNLGMLHIEEIPLAEYGEREQLHKIHLSEEKQQEYNTCKELAEMLDEAVGYVPASVIDQLKNSRELEQQYLHWEKQSISSLSSAARVQHAKVRSFKRRERNLTDDLQVMAAYEEVVDGLAPLVETTELPQNYEFVGVIFEQRNRSARGLLQEELEKRTAGQYKYLETTISGGRTAALVGFHTQFRSEMRSFISQAGISEMSFPRHLRNRPFEEAFAMLEQELEQLREKRRALHEQAERFYEEKGAQLLAMQHVCSDMLSRFDAIGKFARTRHAFVMKGWVERSNLDRFRKALGEEVDDSVVVREIRKPDIGSPPVRLRNAKPARYFEPLLRLFPAPKYGSIDPTRFLALFFPPMFGLMLGDIGYGALIVIGAAILYLSTRGKQLAQSLAIVAGLGGLFSIVFGIVFGEFFGTLGHELGLHALWRERFPADGEGVRQSIIGYLFIAGAVGLVHVTVGFVLGMVTAHRSGDRDGFIGSLARLLGIYVLLFVVGSILNVLPGIFLWAGLAAAAAFVVLVVMETAHDPTHGLMLPLEVLSGMGNILSYARIMAVGMASVVLAFLANMFGGMIGNVVFALLIAVLFHALTLFLGVVDPTIQGLRLHYVEFFSKFYKSGGKPFTPFRKLRSELAFTA